MSELVLDRDERLALKAQAHALNPVVLLGAAGLNAAVLAEIDRALASHGLIKVRIPSADRDEREAMFAEIADRLAAARVQAIGKLLVLYRPPPPETERKLAPERGREQPPATRASRRSKQSERGPGPSGKAGRRAAPPKRVPQGRRTRQT